jgi:Zn-dependent protease with chaperone function
MNFFQAQEQARKSSRMLVCWFALAVIGVIGVIYFLATFALQFGASKDQSYVDLSETGDLGWWNPSLLLWTAIIVGGVILIGSLTKLSQLSAGGKVVAQSLGGRRVEPSSGDFLENRLVNVVEEMAIASGVPVPEVWVMDEEPGINAFAAGTDPANAVIGVTRGTLERLNRSELQGVIAHEFSHILNGDMKLNIRLMGWIFGLVMLSMMGRMILQSLRFVRGSRDSKGGGILLAIVVAGAAVWLVGSIGVLFARMIQAAISRQREFLADASAVQFTRDPDGISGALKKIGGFAEHGKISSPKATEARHMFFAGSALSSIMATHPPLDKRIKAIDPRWNGEMLEGKPNQAASSEFSGAMGFSGVGNQVSASGEVAELGESDRLDSTVGAALNHEFHTGDANPASKDEAKVLLLGLLARPDAGGSEVLRSVLEGQGFDPAVSEQIIESGRKSSDFSSAKKLGLVDLSLNWLKRMHQAEARQFVATTEALIVADHQIDLFEFMLQQVLRRHVEIGLGLEPVPNMKYRRLVDLEPEVSALLSAFGELGGGSASLQKAFAEYREHTGNDLEIGSAGLADVAAALKKFDAATPLIKNQILRMCSLTVMHDGKVDQAELELLRAMSEAMGAPIPPMVRMVGHE